MYSFLRCPASLDDIAHSPNGFKYETSFWRASPQVLVVAGADSALDRPSQIRGSSPLFAHAVHDEASDASQQQSGAERPKGRNAIFETLGIFEKK